MDGCDSDVEKVEEAVGKTDFKWRKNTKEERRAQKKRRKQRLREIFEQKKQTESDLVEELENVKKLKKEADLKACQQQEEAKKFKCRYVQLKERCGMSGSSLGVADNFLGVPRIERRDIIVSAHADEHGKCKAVGSGTFSTCHLGRYRGVMVAVKKIKHPSVSKIDVEREGAIMMSLTHPGLSHLFGICTECKPYLIITQFHGAKEGKLCIPLTLRQYLKSEKYKERITEADMTRILIMICDALQYLHQRGIIHNDLKSDNIVLESRGNDMLSPVIIDFGKACLLKDAMFHRVNKADQPEYMKKHGHIAPEVIAGQCKQSESSDIFALGFTVAEVARHQHDCTYLQKIASMCMAEWTVRPSLSFILCELKT